MADVNFFTDDSLDDHLTNDESVDKGETKSMPEYVTFIYDEKQNYPIYKDGKFFDKKKLLYSLRDAIKRVDWTARDPNDEVAFKIKMQKAFSFATSDWLSGDETDTQIVNENLDDAIVATDSDVVYSDDASDDDETTEWV